MDPPVKQHQQPVATSNSKKKKSKRHGARNQDKSKVFVKWLLATFGTNATGGHVVDVAGGKGELAARLALCHNAASVTLIDPRQPRVDLQDVYLGRVVPRLPEKWQKRLAMRRQETPGFLENLIAKRFRQLEYYFSDESVENNGDIVDALDKCTLLIGLHADSATECIVDTALRLNIPFVVVPCCVFPNSNLFRRRTIVGDSGIVEEVRNHEQFCKYLLGKDSRLQLAELSFEGRNIAIWWDGRDEVGNDACLEH